MSTRPFAIYKIIYHVNVYVLFSRRNIFPFRAAPVIFWLQKHASVVMAFLVANVIVFFLFVQSCKSQHMVLCTLPICDFKRKISHVVYVPFSRHNIFPIGADRVNLLAGKHRPMWSWRF